MTSNQIYLEQIASKNIKFNVNTVFQFEGVRSITI